MKRCAIYTRKSSDEGLDQAFNSLDAQREACEAYVASQVGEGWRATTDRYDDGGCSGGSMDRPDLKRLLNDVAAGKVDIIVVYKVDRLTRSLADFARIVDILDNAGASFVSVTQAFNTTTSMGRLTLNVLLSFAQFEREVTGERIRDKIAASKAKGMWMGGLPPLGYDPPDSSERRLRVNVEEARTVLAIFERYLELGSVHALTRELEAQGIGSKIRHRSDGTTFGGAAISHGALLHLLRNPVYCGKIVHRGEHFEGRHDRIIDQAMFDQVQQRLHDQRRARRDPQLSRSPLTGKLFLADGTRLTSCRSRGSKGRYYRYFVAAGQNQASEQGALLRLPAPKFEARMRALLQPIERGTQDPLSLVERIVIHRDRLELTVERSIEAKVRSAIGPDDELIVTNGSLVMWRVPFDWPSRAIRCYSLAARSRRDEVLIRALRKAHAMLEHDHRGNPLLRSVPQARYESRLARLAFLSPRLQRAILDGRQPAALTLEKIVRGQLPLAWADQEEWARQRA